MPREKVVTLGGQEYRVSQLNMKDNRLWRDTLAQPITDLLALLEGNRELEIGSVGDLAQVIGIGKQLLLGSMDILLDALFAYSPELRADRDRIEAEAYDDEAIAALAEVVRLAYPLGVAISAFRGLPVTPTSTNSPLPNGASGTKQPLVGHRKRT